MSEELFIYHSTAVETIPTILQEGLVSSGENHRSNAESDLEAMADQKDICLPIKRQECIFLYPSLRQAVEMATFERGPPGSLPAVFARSGLLVIEATSLDEDLYLADFDLFSEVIDLQYIPPDDIIQSESYEAALTNYAKSVTPFDAFDSIDEISNSFRRPELLIEADIPPTAIRETLLYKEVLGTEWFSSYPALPVGDRS